MTRDHLLGFPPVLLAQDDQMPRSDEGPRFPLGIPERAYTECKSRPEYKRTRELMAFEMIPVRPGITEAGCRHVRLSAEDAWSALSRTSAAGAHYYGLFVDEASQVTIPRLSTSAEPSEFYATAALDGPYASYTGVSLAGTVATDPQPGASPISPTGVWRKTAEHRPPVGTEHLTRYTGNGCDRSPDVRPLVWDGNVWREGAAPVGSKMLRDWLDTSGEFKVGDRVRYRPGACGSGVELAEMVFTVAALETQDGKPALRFSDGEYDYSEDLEHA